ncbi:hypothetical protein EC973_008052 [Apophysomyces ossiformis]|uniref:BHLH domain-containing protein n=1 Tax=Apophysomyces ossiformis TaxID=679940 RepID=A0A8H7BR48_9FUNG|nr:hypothetical protein EC973_008052 [Apophysomyces ossiformis]
MDQRPDRRPSLDPNSRTLYPLSSFRHHPYLDRTPSPSNSRRGSMTDPALHATCRPSPSPLSGNSPPSSPSHRANAIRPSHMDLRSDLAGRFLPPSSASSTNTPSPWRRDSLPSISHITGNDFSYNNPMIHPSNSAMLDDPIARRHSIAVSAQEPSSGNSSPGTEQEANHEDTSTAERPRRGSQMYSRSPELRVSHKLAERKRRKEMKDLFDELRDLLPLDKGLKTSKWEILSKSKSLSFFCLDKGDLY